MHEEVKPSMSRGLHLCDSPAKGVTWKYKRDPWFQSPFVHRFRVKLKAKIMVGGNLFHKEL
jgi:hypothetical protein